jgi:hypothetical protein
MGFIIGFLSLGLYHTYIVSVEITVDIRFLPLVFYCIFCKIFLLYDSTAPTPHIQQAIQNNNIGKKNKWLIITIPRKIMKNPPQNEEYKSPIGPNKTQNNSAAATLL